MTLFGADLYTIIIGYIPWQRASVEAPPEASDEKRHNVRLDGLSDRPGAKMKIQSHQVIEHKGLWKTIDAFGRPAFGQ